MARALGAVGREKPVTEKVQAYVGAVLPDVAAHAPELAAAVSVDAVRYAVQVVAGVNFFVKVKFVLGGGKQTFAHLRIYRDLKGNVSLSAVQTGKTADDAITYFD